MHADTALTLCKTGLGLMNVETCSSLLARHPPPPAAMVMTCNKSQAETRGYIRGKRSGFARCKFFLVQLLFNSCLSCLCRKVSKHREASVPLLCSCVSSPQFHACASKEKDMSARPRWSRRSCLLESVQKHSDRFPLWHDFTLCYHGQSA